MNEPVCVWVGEVVLCFVFFIWGFISSSSSFPKFAGFVGFFVGWIVGVFVARCTEWLVGFVDWVRWLNPDSIFSKKEGNMWSMLGLPVLTNDMSESGM